MTPSGKPVALVTGASRGIGAAIARRLAADGMAVAVNSHPDEPRVLAAKNIVADLRQAGHRAAVYPADISAADDVDAMFSQCEDELGRVVALVLNAAATGRATWSDLTEGEWDRLSAVNLKSAFLCCRRAFGPENSDSDGRIVTVSSIQADIGVPGSLHYNTTKAGIIGFTRSLARELGERGVRVNCVMPGAIRTEAELEMFPDQREAERVVFSKQCLHRRGLPDDIAGAVSFLLGPDSAFITGQTLCVDGGWVFR